MIVEWGHLAFILSLCLALCQATVTWWGVSRRRAGVLLLARYTSFGQLLMTGFAFVALGVAFLSNDWSVAYVARNANSAMPWIYRLCAIWGAHEGSMLLWVLILTAWMAAVAWFGRGLPLAIQARVLAVLAWVAIGFDLFIITTSNPFLRLLPQVPQHGVGLNPLLQDPGLVSHPPMLYLGYVGFSVAFAFAITGLLTKRLDQTWARWARPWTLAAWSSLTIGIVLGSWWAYRELGWGGWWFWDPVENASFMPWLAGTALLHSLRVTERRGTCKAWTVLLAVFAFSLSLLGTFLVRSGVLISVHAFAVDPQRGGYILVFLSVVIGLSLLLYAVRARYLAQSGLIAPLSRAGLLLMNNVLLFTALMTVLLGTLYPLIVDAVGWERISVGAPYFNSIFMPLMWPVLLLMGFAPFLFWTDHQLQDMRRSLFVVAAVTALLALLLPLVIVGKITWPVWTGLWVALWLLATTIIGLIVLRNGLWSWGMLWTKLPMTVAHLGVVVCALGIILSSHYSRTALLTMRVGETAVLAPYKIKLQNIKRVVGPNYNADQAAVVLYRNNLPIKVLTPQQRYYTHAGMQIAKTAIDELLWRDLYVALGAQQPDGRWGMRFYDKPFVRWIWWGGILMALGAILGILRRRTS